METGDFHDSEKARTKIIHFADLKKMAKMSEKMAKILHFMCNLCLKNVFFPCVCFALFIAPYIIVSKYIH